MLALLIPIIALMIPIVAILTAHQQKMANFFQQGRAVQGNEEIAALRHEVQELREIVHQQVLALDSYASRRPIEPPPVETLK